MPLLYANCLFMSICACVIPDCLCNRCCDFCYNLFSICYILVSSVVPLCSAIASLQRNAAEFDIQSFFPNCRPSTLRSSRDGLWYLRFHNDCPFRGILTSVPNLPYATFYIVIAYYVWSCYRSFTTTENTTTSH